MINKPPPFKGLKIRIPIILGLGCRVNLNLFIRIPANLGLGLRVQSLGPSY